MHFFFKKNTYERCAALTPFNRTIGYSKHLHGDRKVFQVVCKLAKCLEFFQTDILEYHRIQIKYNE